VDQHQWCHVLIMPLSLAPRSPVEWSNWALQPAVDTFRRYGLAVEIHDGDLWLDGRKIAGSGSATIGGCAVIASSFLMRFPAQKFACGIAGSQEFREWLQQGLEQAMTDWASHACVPDSMELRDVHAAAVGGAFGWNLQPSSLTTVESAVIAEVMTDTDEEDHGGSRIRAGGIKLNAKSWLVEHVQSGASVRELVVCGVLVRREIITA